MSANEGNYELVLYKNKVSSGNARDSSVIDITCGYTRHTSPCSEYPGDCLISSVTLVIDNSAHMFITLT